MKAFEITKTVSTAQWNDVSKPRLWQQLKKGLDDGAGGVAQAVKEVYAVVKAEVNKDLTQANCLLPHHEISDDGTITTSRAGVIAAAAALAGPSSKSDLTDEQKAAARKHLLRHYREMEMDPPESLAGEMTGLRAKIAGEMSPDDVPLTPGVDLAALKDGDEDPLEVVVEVPAGKSTRGWNYQEKAIKDIVKKVKEQTLSGFLGHQKEEEVSTQFPVPVTHWVGAKWKDGKGYFRGVIDKAAGDLKRWIRAKRVSQVSIFGIPSLEQVGGETNVVGYNAFSIDWTPLGRAGMPTRIVAMGEMDSTLLGGELDGSHEELRLELDEAVGKKFNRDRENRRYVWIEKVYDDHVIIQVEDNEQRKFYSVSFAVADGEVKLGEPTEGKFVQQFIPISGEMKNNQGDDGNMTMQEMLAAIRSAIAKGELKFPEIMGEIGVTKDQAIEILVGEELRKAKVGAEFGAKLANALGMTLDTKVEDAIKHAGEMVGVWKALGFDKEKPEEPAKVVGEMVKVQAESAKAAHAKLVEDTIKEKVSGEQAQALVRRMLQVQAGTTKDQVVGEIDALLNDEAVKGILGKSFVDKPAGTGGNRGSDDTEPKHLLVKKVAI